MNATTILSNEHRVIEQVLSCLEGIAERAAAEESLDVQAARDALNFCREFADRCHHGKEEDRLFPVLEARGIPREDGPIGVMLDEHEQGRTHVRAMATSLEAVAQGDRVAVWQFVEHVQPYVSLLREHIRKEDHCLFPLANRVLTPDDQIALQSAFEEADRTTDGRNAYVELAASLAVRCGISPITVCDDA